MAQVLLITGGASGIGAAVARLAVRRGYAIAINYRSRRTQAEALVQELRANGGSAVAVQADVAEPEQVARLYAEVEQELGRPTAVVNSAGIATPAWRVDDAGPEQLNRLFRVNVLGVMSSCREAARRLSTRHGGSGGVIINVSSMAASIGGRPGNAHYAASKAAVDAFSIGFAKEVATEGIRVLSLRPGFTVTDMTRQGLDDVAFRQVLSETIPLGRPARVEEVAAPIVWLLSDEASFITGTCIDVSGGGFAVASEPRRR